MCVCVYTQYITLTYSFPDLEPACCSMSNSNCCFLTCIQISQEAGQVVWYPHLLKNFPQFVLIFFSFLYLSAVEGRSMDSKSEKRVVWMEIRILCSCPGKKR